MAADALWLEENRIIHLIAGAGSGKTTTLIETVARGIASGFTPEKICMITFTRKAAAEMRERLARKNISTGFTGTMHSLGYWLIRQTMENPPKIIRHPEKILMEIVETNFPQYSHIPPRILIRRNFLTGEDSIRLKKLYAEVKTSHHLMDLDDLIFRATSILRENRKKFPFSCVLVDEFQDTSPDQLEFIQAMQCDKLFAVGDDWQSIYAFRGADVGIALKFRDHFPQSQRLFLTHNFRSQKKIVRLGNRAIRLSGSFIRKKLLAFHRSGKSPVCFIAEGTDDAQAVWQHYARKKHSPTFPQNLTILVRTNRLRRTLLGCVPAGVEVLTIHAAKGMEFEHVLVFGIAHDVFPHKWNNFDEEVRLLYVAITRAKSALEFVAWDYRGKSSEFTAFLVRRCRLSYLTTSWRDPERMA